MGWEGSKKKQYTQPKGGGRRFFFFFFHCLACLITMYACNVINQATNQQTHHSSKKTPSNATFFYKRKVNKPEDNGLACPPWGRQPRTRIHTHIHPANSFCGFVLFRPLPGILETLSSPPCVLPINRMRGEVEGDEEKGIAKKKKRKRKRTTRTGPRSGQSIKINLMFML